MIVEWERDVRTCVDCGSVTLSGGTVVGSVV